MRNHNRDALWEYVPSPGRNQGIQIVGILFGCCAGMVARPSQHDSWRDLISTACSLLLLNLSLFFRIPAPCPNCGRRRASRLIRYHIELKGRPRSTLLRNECRFCGYEMPQRKAFQAKARKNSPASDQVRSSERLTLLEGTVDGIPYRVETWVLRRIAVLIDLPQSRMRLPSLFCTTYWGPFIPDDGKWGQEEAQRLFDLGATAVGVGCMSNTIDVTFERDGVPLTRQRVEEAVRVMAILRRRALGEWE